jgi:hypothetical protein
MKKLLIIVIFLKINLKNIEILTKKNIEIKSVESSIGTK